MNGCVQRGAEAGCEVEDGGAITKMACAITAEHALRQAEEHVLPEGRMALRWSQCAENYLGTITHTSLGPDELESCDAWLVIYSLFATFCT